MVETDYNGDPHYRVVADYKEHPFDQCMGKSNIVRDQNACGTGVTHQWCEILGQNHAGRLSGDSGLDELLVFDKNQVPGAAVFYTIYPRDGVVAATLFADDVRELLPDL